MGVAAYNRTSRVLSRNLCHQSGCRGCSNCREHTPTPRPPDWGNKIQAKAQRRAVGLLRYMRSRGHEVTVEDIADMIRQEIRCGKKTARGAAEFAFAGG